MIVIMGASGNTGRPAAEALLSQGHQVRVLGRDKSRLEPLVQKGAEAAVGEATDVAFLTQAFRGTDIVYAMIPPDYAAPDVHAHYDRVGDAIVQAIQDSGVQKIVFLSSLGADVPAGTGPVVGLHAQENKLRAIPGIDLHILRPTYFFENFFGNLDMIRAQGSNGGATAADVPLPMIATVDIGAAAAKVLADPTFTGVSIQELLGPKDLTMAEATSLIGAAIGKPDLAYVQFPYADFAAGLVSAGFTPNLAGLFAEMSKAFNEGLIKPLDGRNAENTTPTRFEDFVPALAAAYAAGA